MSSLTAFYQITDDIIQKVRESFGKDEKSVQEDLRILNEWWKKQPHLPPNTDDARLERILLRNKFRVEHTKIKIDNYYSMRAIYPQQFDDMRQNYNGVVATSDGVYVAPAPTLTPMHERVVLCAIRAPHVPLNWTRLFSYAFLCMESSFSNDYTVGEHYVLDCTNLTMQHYTSMTRDIPALLTAIQLYQEAYSGRIIGLHFVNTPSYLDLFIALLKLMLKPKLFSKIIVYNSLEDLHQSVKPKYLPPCLGGFLQHEQYYHDKLKEVILSQREEIIKNLGRISNETLRSAKFTENHLFGIDGTFKKINID